jgi:UDP-glucuronate decarboxylase
MNFTNKNSMKKILVTGAAGNIGSSLVSSLLERGSYYVVGVDNLSTGDRSKLPSNSMEFRFIKADVNSYNDISSIFSSFDFDYVFHFAAIVGVKRTLDNPLSVLNDIQGISNILTLSKNSCVRRVFYSSSSEVYGEPVSIPQHEDFTPLNSRLPYAIVKNLGEAYFKSFFQEHNLSYTIFRFFNTYGPRQSEDFVIPRFVKSALNNSPIFINGNGSQTRTFCYIDDNVDTMIGCLEKELYVNDVLNIGSDVEYSIIDLAKIVINKVSSTSEIVHLPALVEGDMSRRKPDITKMKVLLKRSTISLEQGLDNLIKYYKSI